MGKTLNVRQIRYGTLYVKDEHVKQADEEGMSLDELAGELIADVEWNDDDIEAEDDD